MKDKLVWPLIIVLVVCIGVLVLCPDLLPGGTPAPQTSALSQQEYGQLAVQLSELTHQQERVRKEFEQQIKGVGTLTLMFTDFGPYFVETLLPPMDAVSMTGMLAFTDTKYPGAEGCLTLAQWHELQTNGWTCCLYWDGSAPLDAWLTQTTARLTQLGLPAMDVLCIAEGAYNREDIPLLKQHGITAVVAYPESKVAYSMELVTDGMVEIGAMLWHANDAANGVQTAGAAGGAIVLTVAREEFDKGAEYLEAYQSMVDTVLGWENGGTIVITDVRGSIAHRQAVKDGQAALSAEMEQTLNDLQVQIDAITQQMNSLLQ